MLTVIDIICADGMEQKGTECVDIDECARNSDDCHVQAVCKNTHSSYTCTCKPGYQGNGKQCRNVNECTTGANDCDRDAECTDTVGSYSCSCKDGYVGNGKQCKGNAPLYAHKVTPAFEK